MEIIYQGEHLGIGNFGHFAVVLAFTAALFGAFAYFNAAKNPIEGEGWRKLGRIAFFIHSFAVISIVASLFYIIHSHYFEYHYAWQHSSRSLPVHFMISCFWEGQEGSFLLWIFWQVVIGFFLLRTARNWENPVMSILNLSQVVLTSMLLGVHVFGFKIGSSPFSLLRDTMTDAPIFSDPQYLAKYITDGNGLNPLLQNYWMVIHPPTLFFGFAATVAPFAYAVSALWTKNYRDWLKPALPWALIAVMILGAGIIMGGFWAYESLSFGGYWAWDPVENASLIPWLILIAGVHVMLIHRSASSSKGLSLGLIILTFILVLYATFLTRSGVLGNSSVHSFTDLGLSGQLLIFLSLFAGLPALILLPKNTYKIAYGAFYLAFCTALILDWKLAATIIGLIFLLAAIALPVIFFPKSSESSPKESSPKKEEVNSREFWMFIGALVLVLSAFQVISTTSIPAINKVLGTRIAPPIDAVAHYNKLQMPIALIIALLTGFAQFLKYRKTSLTGFLRNLIITLIISGIVTMACVLLFRLNQPYYILFLFASLFAIVGNLQYLIQVQRTKLSFGGASVAHAGFGLLLVGVLISSVNKQVISYNNVGRDIFGGDDVKTAEANKEHIMLVLNQPVTMGDYQVTYIGDSIAGIDKFYKVHYQGIAGSNKKSESFVLYPDGQQNPKMGFIANPDTRHYFSHDVFTHVSFDPESQKKEEEPFANSKQHKIRTGDTIFTNNAMIVLERINPEGDKTKMPDADLMVSAEMKVITLLHTYAAEPQFALKGNVPYTFDDQVNEAGVRVKFAEILPEEKCYLFETSERAPVQKFIIMKAIVFPYINFVWGGTIIMVIGFVMAIFRRVKEYRSLVKANKA